MKKTINAIITTVENVAFTVRAKAQNALSHSRAFTRRALSGNSGEGYIDTAIFSDRRRAGRAVAVHSVQAVR